MKDIKKIGEAIALFFIAIGAFIGAFILGLFSLLITLICQPFFWLAVIAIVLIKTFL